MTTWIQRWGAEIAATKFPGVWLLKQGGCLVRARATDPATGRMLEIRKRLPSADPPSASAWLEREKVRVRSGRALERQAAPRFSEYASSLLEQKLALGEIQSARGREKWRYTLAHLIGGTPPVAGFGEMFLDRIEPSHVESWRVGISRLIRSGKYKPSTANGWLGVLKVITKSARKMLRLPLDPAEDAPFFDMSTHRTYTEEEPNQLTPEETGRFLTCLQIEYPQHYAMIYLGVATGLRPSHMRPLRRAGRTPDVLWSDAQLLVRRSHTLSTTVERTKNKLRQRIHLPPEVIAVLQWHVDTQLVTEEQRESELLFPREDGLTRSESSLKKVFPTVAAMVGIKKRVTPIAMRRTFNDLQRLAGTEGLVTRSISGQLTEQMREHYSTVTPEEQRKSMRGVLRLIRGGDNGGDTPRRKTAGRRK